MHSSSSRRIPWKNPRQRLSRTRPHPMWTTWWSSSSTPCSSTGWLKTRGHCARSTHLLAPSMPRMRGGRRYEKKPLLFVGPPSRATLGQKAIEVFGKQRPHGEVVETLRRYELRLLGHALSGDGARRGDLFSYRTSIAISSKSASRSGDRTRSITSNERCQTKCPGHRDDRRGHARRTRRYRGYAAWRAQSGALVDAVLSGLHHDQPTPDAGR